MEIYSTEEQQVEAIKRWFKENGNYVVIGVLLGLALVAGSSYYRSSQRQAQEAAAAEFDTVSQVLTTQGMDAASSVDTYVSNHSDATQSLLLSMQMAKVAADAGKYDVAETELKQVVAKAKKDDPLASIGRVQLARVQLAAEKYDDALATLKVEMPAAFAAQAAELEGDIQVLKGDRAAAYAAYKKAAADGNQGSPILNDKLLDVADAAPKS